MTRKNSRFKSVRSAGSLALLGLLVASGCTEEVGGDGFEPKPSRAGTGGVAGSGGVQATGGLPPASGGEGGESEPTSGKGGSAVGGHAGHAGTGGSGIVSSAGMGGEPGGTAVCGNNMVEGDEECDDGNTKSGDGCSADCKKNCEVCEKTFCKAVLAGEAGEFNFRGDPGVVTDAVSNCFDMKGVAAAGPAATVPRKELCQAAVDCAKSEKCVAFAQPSQSGLVRQVMHCLCSDDINDGKYVNDCSNADVYKPGNVPYYAGACSREFQEAAEGDTAAYAFNTFTNFAKPLGAANLLLRYCDLTLCTEECFPSASTGVVAQITADILQDPNEDLESPIGDIMADSQRLATGADIALVDSEAYNQGSGSPGFVYHAAPGRAADADGRLLESEVRQVLLGMGTTAYFRGSSTLLTFQLTGAQIYTLLNQPTPFQVSGITYSRSPVGQPTKIVKDGAPLDKSKTYTVVASEGLQTKFLSTVTTTATNKNPFDALVQYLKAQPQPIAPPTLGRIKTRADCDNGVRDGDETDVDVCPLAHPTCNKTTHQCE